MLNFNISLIKCRFPVFLFTKKLFYVLKVFKVLHKPLFVAYNFYTKQKPAREQGRILKLDL